MNPTNKNLANYYDVSEKTVANYKVGSDGKKRLYVAMKREFITQEQIKEMTWRQNEV